RGGAHHDLKYQAKNNDIVLEQSLRELQQLSPEQLLEKRWDKYKKIGDFNEMKQRRLSREALAFGTTSFTSKYHLKFKLPIKRCLHLIFYRIGIMFKEKENTTLLTLSFFEWIKRVHNRVARRKIRLETNCT